MESLILLFYIFDSLASVKCASDYEKGLLNFNWMALDRSKH